MENTYNFFENFFEFIWSLLVDWPVGTILGILLIVILVVCLLFVVGGIFLAIDSCFIATSNGVGRVITKIFRAAYSETRFVYNPSLKAVLPQTINHPDKWSLVIEVDGKQGTTCVTKETFNKVSEGKTVAIRYGYGRLSGDLYIKGVTV